MAVKVITNNVPRDIIYGHELTAEEQEEFDYFDFEAAKLGEGDIGEFVRYKGELYDLNDTEGIFPTDRRWFYISDSFFSGVLFRYPEDYFGPDGIDTEHIIVGRYYVTSDLEES